MGESLPRLTIEVKDKVNQLDHNGKPMVDAKSSASTIPVPTKRKPGALVASKPSAKRPRTTTTNSTPNHQEMVGDGGREGWAPSKGVSKSGNKASRTPIQPKMSAPVVPRVPNQKAKKEEDHLPKPEGGTSTPLSVPIVMGCDQVHYGNKTVMFTEAQEVADGTPSNTCNDSTEKTKNQNKSITVTNVKKGNLNQTIYTVHSTTLDKLVQFKFVKQDCPPNTMKEDLPNYKVHENTRNTGNNPETCSKMNRVTLSIKGKKVLSLKPPQKTKMKAKPKKMPKKTNQIVNISNQPTLTMLLEKTGDELGNFWDSKIYENERTHRRRRILVHDRLKTDDARITKEEVN